MAHDLKCILDYCNEVRAKLGREPITEIQKGIPRHGTLCPIARTINRGAEQPVMVVSGYVTAVLVESVERYNNPVCVEHFICDLDNGLLPEFES